MAHNRQREAEARRARIAQLVAEGYTPQEARAIAYGKRRHRPDLPSSKELRELERHRFPGERLSDTARRKVWERRILAGCAFGLDQVVSYPWGLHIESRRFTSLYRAMRNAGTDRSTSEQGAFATHSPAATSFWLDDYRSPLVEYVGRQITSAALLKQALTEVQEVIYGVYAGAIVFLTFYMPDSPYPETAR